MTRILGALLAAGLSVLVLVGMGFAGAYQYLAPEIPQAAALRDVRTQLPLRVYSKDGKLIAQIGEQRRIPVAFEQIPQVVVDAFLAAEDARFFEHPGVDWQSLVRALVANVSAGSAREGGGTITMQLARNTVLTSEKTLRRKLKEVFLALRLEREFTKQEILTLYLNRIFLGQRAYGIGAAAEVYFDKTVPQLTLAEAALIAGLPRSPSLDNPVASLERAHDRRAYVLRRMLELGKIDQSQHDAALDETLTSRMHGPIIELEAPYVAEMVRAEMVRLHGADALTAGYRVATTIDSRLQQAANASVWRTVLEYERRHGYRGPVERIDAAQLADQAVLGAVFKRHPRRGSLQPAVTTAVADRSAEFMLRNGAIVTVDWESMSWARPVIDPLKDAMGPFPKVAREVVAPGDVVYLEPLPEGRFRLGQLPAVAGALVALDPNDGAIVALVGGFDFGASKYNRALQAQRQPGSAFKPFLYSAALERGFTPATLVNDAPIVLPGGGGAEGDEEWRPQNITRKFYGPTPMREGLVRSRNLVSIRLLRGAGIGFATRHIAQFGFGPQALPANLTLALGTGQVTPLEMVRGFSVFANGGALVTPYFIQAVDGSAGEKLFEAKPARACGACDFAAPAADATASPPDTSGVSDASAPSSPSSPAGSSGAAGASCSSCAAGAAAAPQAISAANAFVMTDMMTDVIQRGTAQRAATALNRKDIAGKTGTTSDRRDTWFVGFNADYAAAVWVGFDQERSLGENEEGGRTALPMWIYFMQEALRDKPEHRQPEPPGVVRMWVSRETGALSRAGAPGALFEAFLEAYAPQPGMGGIGDDEVGAETVESAPGDDSIF
ncbi:MAG: penicillin-binding protein 1A [Gammaproteobacteria bacterium]|nr:penicillin-binding protein 1A [Gammaproteobacteria bacterium]